MPPITLETPRLRLRQLQPDDRSFFHQLYRDPAVLRFVDPERQTVETEQRFQQRLPAWQQTSEQWLTLVVIERASGTPIGLHGFKLEHPPLGPAETGYLFLPAFQGQGFAHEASTAVLRFAFDTCGLHKVCATVTAGNHASMALLQRLGFQLEGRLRQQYRMAGAWHDDLKYGLLAEEWRARQRSGGSVEGKAGTQLDTDA